MIREIVKIDEEKCDGCGICIPECHEGALQIIDGKARLVSDLMCDGLGACLGHCPQNAITIEKREAEPYDEIEIIRIMVEKGRNTVVAHLKHLKDHNETNFLGQAVQWLRENEEKIDLDVQSIIHEVHDSGHSSGDSCGCQGSKEMMFNRDESSSEESITGVSQLTHWPVQLHLINPLSAVYQGADLLLAADCVAFSLGNFHDKYLKGKALAIACPKLDSGQAVYSQKLLQLIEDAKINTITVMVMQVPCCAGLIQLVQTAISQADRKVPVKGVVVGVDGGILAENWL